MTTIATDGKTVAADGRITADFIDSDEAIKIVEIRGEIVGTRGDCDLGEAYLDWVSAGSDPDHKPDVPEEWDADFFEALHVSRLGVFYVGGRNFAKIKMEAPMAIGSGGVLARTAMRLGKTPKEAVEFAITLDPHSGGKITELRVEDICPD